MENAASIKILVADDDPAIVDSLQFMLETEGYAVETTVNGETARMVERCKPNLILLDIWMSGQDGREVCKHLKSVTSTKNIPIIMVSANRDTEFFAKESGADDFLSKPFDMSDLLKKIAKHVR